MKIVEYERALHLVRDLKCESCEGLTPAWRSSAMSECFPHFFCNTCSNVIHRDADKKIVRYEKSQKVLDNISKTLPMCSCGGQFTPKCGPKCKHCNAEIPIVSDAVEYLHNPNMVVIDGACAFSDKRYPYMVRIIENEEEQNNKSLKRNKKSWFSLLRRLF